MHARPGRRLLARSGRALGALAVVGALVAVVPATAGALGPPPYFSAAPPTIAQCQQSWGESCYTPSEIETAYDMKPLYASGLDGRGETIALVDSFGSPTIAHDLAEFDSGFGLPPPPSFRIIHPAGAIPAYNADNTQMADWAFETSLDVEYAHAMAPGANLLLVETPVAETLGTAGFPQIVTAENDVIDHHLAQVISQSFGCAEETFPSAASLLALRSDYVNAAAHHVTVLAGSGDNGPTSPTNVAETNFFTRRVGEWPADDPLVTAVGGTQLTLSPSGARLAPDRTYNDTALVGAPEAGSGGVSAIFARPSYQDGVKAVVGDHRGFPDVSMSASAAGSVLVYLSFPDLRAGWYPANGTSEATPLFAGVVAVADQAAHRSLGFLNPRLYALAAEHAPGLVPVTVGTTTVHFRQDGHSYTVEGWSATAGYNLATGLGTVNGDDLVHELAQR